VSSTIDFAGHGERKRCEHPVQRIGHDLWCFGGVADVDHPRVNSWILRGLLAGLIFAAAQRLSAAEPSIPSSPPDEPGVWIVPPPWPGNGDCLRELIDRDREWTTTRHSIRGVGYYLWLLNHFHSDLEIRKLFTQLEAWQLGFGLEVPVLKPPNWGFPQPLKNEDAFDALLRFTKRFRSLGMQRIDYLAFDEPVYAARHAMPAAGQEVPTVVDVELVGGTKIDPVAARRIAFGVSETVAFMQRARGAYPGTRLGIIEPYPALSSDELKAAIATIQKNCEKNAIAGLDFFRIDIDWYLIEQQQTGSWSDIQQLQQFCRKQGLDFSIIFWAANYPRLAGNTAGDSAGRESIPADVWTEAVLHQGQSYHRVGGRLDEIVIQSWLPVPQHAVPESARHTFTGSVLQFQERFPPHVWSADRD
jgi:hypothetical protein